jgi:hypothetical protein
LDQGTSVIALVNCPRLFMICEEDFANGFIAFVSHRKCIAALRRWVDIFIRCNGAFDKLPQSSVVLFAAYNKSIIV